MITGRLPGQGLLLNWLIWVLQLLSIARCGEHYAEAMGFWLHVALVCCSAVLALGAGWHAEVHGAHRSYTPQSGHVWRHLPCQSVLLIWIIWVLQL
jgi:hypothetical protein